MTAERRGARRSPEKEAGWRKVIRDWRESGETLREFAKGRGISPWTIRWWCSELRKRDVERKTSATVAEVPSATTRAARSPVVPVRIVKTKSPQWGRGTALRPTPLLGPETVGAEGPVGTGTAGNVIEIVPFGQVRIRLPADINPGVLRTLLDLLEARC